MTSTLAALPGSKVTSASTFWSTGSRQFVSADGHETYAVLQLAGADDAAKIKTFDSIENQLAAPGLTEHAGGQIPSEGAINKQVTKDIGRAEGLSMPALLILLLIIFGGLAAASLPLAIGGIAILGSFTALRALTLFTPVSIYSINITTILGLGLAIDYGLFMVGRFREELTRAGSTEQAVARTVATAGRTVAVSGVTVAIALASLMLFPMTFLRSMGYGGVATVLVDMIAALTLLPALLAVLGPKVNALRIRPRRRAEARLADETSGGWYRIAHSVMRRPVIYVVVIVAGLATLGTPFLHISWGGVDARALPAAAAPRVVTEALNKDFPGNVTQPIEAVLRFPGPATSPPDQAALASYVSKLGGIDGVTGAHVTGVKGDVARVDLRTPLIQSPRRPALSSAMFALRRPRPARRPTSAGPPRSSATSCPAWARCCRGWPWSSCSPRSSCCSWPSARWSCPSRRSWPTCCRWARRSAWSSGSSRRAICRACSASRLRGRSTRPCRF